MTSERYLDSLRSADISRLVLPVARPGVQRTSVAVVSGFRGALGSLTTLCCRFSGALGSLTTLCCRLRGAIGSLATLCCVIRSLSGVR